MEQKSKKIKILIILGIIILVVFGLYYFFRDKTPTDQPSPDQPGYQDYNPFGSGSSVGQGDQTPGEDSGSLSFNSRFEKITDFGVAGMTIFEYERLIETGQPQTPVSIPIYPDTREGRRGIQEILNKELNINLTTDGVFGSKTTKAIKDFQTLKGLNPSGLIDENTSVYFTKIDNSNLPQTEKVEAMRFVEKSNGHIYHMDFDKKSITKISNTTIPQIHEAIFNNSGSRAIYRYLSSDKTIASYLVNVSNGNGEFLPSGVSEIVPSLDKSRYFYLLKNQNGVSGSIGMFLENRNIPFFNSSFSEWLAQWTRSDVVYLNTKPSYLVNGSLFSLNINDGVLSKVLGGIKGLTTLVNNNGGLVLVGSSLEVGPKMQIFDTTRNEYKDLNTYGLPEKCVWSKDNITFFCGVPNKITGTQYPDYWYQGLASFDDYFIEMNTSDMNKVTLANSTDEISVDATKLMLNKEENTLYFINKKDSTLWSLRIK